MPTIKADIFFHRPDKINPLTILAYLHPALTSHLLQTKEDLTFHLNKPIEEENHLQWTQQQQQPNP